MGLFSSSYKYYAYAGTSSLFDEDTRPNTVLQLMLQGIITGDASPAEAIVIGLNTNLYARAKSMMRYASKDPGGYFFGFPTTNQSVYNINAAMIKPYVEADAGGAVNLRTLNWNPFDHPDSQVFFTEKEINEQYLNTSYFPWDGLIGNPTDTNWSPVDDEIEIPVEDTSNPGTYLTSNNKYEVSISGNNYQVSFPYYAGTWDVAQPFNLSTYNVAGTWIQVRYRMDGGGDQYLYWSYLIGSGLNPALEAEITSSQLDMQYLPIAVLMHDTVWFDEAGEPEWEDTLDRLLKDLAMDPYDIKEQYLEQQAEDDASGESNRAGAEDWDFFIHFNIPLKTIDRGGREYLFYLYDWLRTRSTWTTFAEYKAFIDGGQFGEQPFSKLNVEEGEEYTGYIARYGWSYIERVDNAGSFTPPGWVDPLLPGRVWSKTYQLGDADYNEGLDWVHGVGNYSVAITQPEGQEHSYTLVVKDNRDNTHSIILMMGPSMEYQINTSQEPVGVGDNGYVDYRYRFVDVELFPEDPEENSEFRWPVHVASLKEVGAMRREAALADGLCATVFLVQKQKVKWYQQTFWKWLIVIVVVIIVVLLWQYQVLPGIATAAGLATGGTALALWALYVVLVFAIGFLVSFAGGLIGGRLGQLFVIVAMFMAMGGNFSQINPFSNMQSAWTNLSTAPSFGSAVQFIQAVYPALSVGQRIYIEHRVSALEDEMRDFTKTAREQYEELQNAWDSLQQTPDWLDPLDLARTFASTGLYEDPDSFYYRTLHANPGTLGYDLIYNFTDMALYLPKQGQPQGIVDNMIDIFEKQRGHT